MSEYLQPFCSDISVEQKCEMFAIRNRMIQIDYNFPKNNIQTKCWCGTTENMLHIYKCELFCENIEKSSLPYNYIYDGNLKQQTEVYFGKYFFEVALVLRNSLLLSSLLLNSEAWVNLTDNDIRSLEQTDEILLSRILEADGNTSNAMKYLELGICPLRFEMKKRKVLFL